MNILEFASEAPQIYRILLILAFAGVAHLMVTIIKYISQLILVGGEKTIETGSSAFAGRFPRTASIVTILESTLTFIIYFAAIGFILQEFNLSLRAYLASTTVIALAIGFGSQGLVQDIVVGLTLIFWNLVRVGDVVDLSGQIGRVEGIGLRYTVLINLHGQHIHLPNRNIAVISRFRNGCIRAYIDFQIPDGATAKRISQIVDPLAVSLYNQHRAIVVDEPLNFGQQNTIKGGWSFIRYKFKIWPGQGALIENNFRQMALSKLREKFPEYADWMITITYRSERLIIKDGELIDEADSDQEDKTDNTGTAGSTGSTKNSV